MAKSKTTERAEAQSVRVRNAATGRYVADGWAVRRSSKRETERQPVSLVGVAARITGDAGAAARWYARPNGLLGGRTPEQAVNEGDRERVMGLLLNIAGQ